MSATFTRVSGLLLCVLLAAPLAYSQTLADSVPSIDVVRNRLNLTDQQQAKLSPLFQQRAAEIKDTRLRLEEAGTRTEKQSIMRDAKAAARSFNTQVESVLDTSQKAEWRE